MRTQALVVIGALAVAFSALAKSDESLIKKLDIASLDFDLPRAIQLRADMAALQRDEFIESKDGFPQARAATFLIDSKDGKVKQRSDAFLYDHNPPVTVPKDWATRYKIKSEQAAP